MNNSKVKLTDVHVKSFTPVVTPRALKESHRICQNSIDTVRGGRQDVIDILSGKSKQLLVVVGPCSIHEQDAALDYAERLAPLVRRYNDRMKILMRAYFEKPRTTVGWKGLVYDPFLDGSNTIGHGLALARQIVLRITAMGVPVATEFLDPLIPQFIDDGIVWAAVGARTTESQTHREMASGLSMPVGFKNATNGDVQIAIDAMITAGSPHSFLGIDDMGRTGIVCTTGNPWRNIVLRGGNGHTNYDRQTLIAVNECLRKAGLPQKTLVDCSHGNSRKNHRNQETVWNAVVTEFKHGDTGVFGGMLESNLFEGKQSIPTNLSGFDRGSLRYGISVTDECIGWEQTESILQKTYDALK